MKKRLFVCVILIITMVYMFVSCSNDVTEANKLGKISIGNRGLKAIGTVVTYNSEVEDLYWYYSATKADDGYRTGQTSGFVPVSDPETQGLSGKILNSDGFSYGLWNIELKGYTTATDANLAENSAEYQASVKKFLVSNDMNYATVEIEVGENAETSVEFGDIWFAADNIVATSKFSLEVRDNKGIVTVSSNPSDVTVDGTGHKVSYKNLTYSPENGKSITGEHTMEFVLTQELSGTGNTTMEAALYTLKFDVKPGTKTVISGDMIKNDQTGDIQINGLQNVPATTLSKIIPVYDGASTDKATVKAKTEIQVGDLKVTYPVGAIIVPGTNGLAGSGDNMTSDGMVGFEYKSAEDPANIEIKEAHTSAKYELTLSAVTDNTNETLLTVEKNIGKNLEILKIYHEDRELTATESTDTEYYSYNRETGVLTLHVLHASEFYVVSKQAVAAVGRDMYYSLIDAINAAAENQTVTLLNDVYTERYNLAKDITLNLNGKTLTGTGDYGVVFGITKDSPDRTLKIIGTAGGSKINGTIMIGNNVTGHVTINGGTYENSSHAPVYVNGECNEGCTLEISNAVINGLRTENSEQAECGHGLYLAGRCNTVLTYCKISGFNTGVELRAGKLTVNDCEISGNADPAVFSANKKGTAICGAAIAVSQHTTDYETSLIVNGGTFSGVKALYEEDLQNETAVDAIFLSVLNGTFDGEIESQNCKEFICGGTFSEKPSDEYVAAGCTVNPNADGTWTVSLFAGGDGTKNNPYRINTVDQWENIYRSQVDKVVGRDTTTYYVLTGDIDYTDRTYVTDAERVGYRVTWKNIDLDGNGHTLKNVHDNSTANAECLIGNYFAGTVRIYNMNFDNCNCNGMFYTDADGSARLYCLGLTFENSRIGDSAIVNYLESGTAYVEVVNSSVENCYVYTRGWAGSGAAYIANGGNCKIENCTFKGTVEATCLNGNCKQIGGFIGQDGGTVINCSVLEGSMLRVLGDGRAYAIMPSGAKSHTSGNRFDGQFSSIDASKCYFQGNNDGKQEIARYWTRYNSDIVAENFVFDSENGIVRYIGSKTYTGFAVTQAITTNDVNNWVLGSGGYTFEFERNESVENTVDFTPVSGIVQYIADPLKANRYAFGTSDGTEFAEKERTQMWVTADGTLMRYSVDGNGNGQIISGSQNPALAGITVRVTVSAYDSSGLVGAYSFSYYCTDAN